jgi:hypothetical protein
MAKKAGKPKSKPHKAKPKPSKKAASRSKPSKSASKKILSQSHLYASPPKDTLTKPKSITVPLKESEPISYSTMPSFAPSIPVSSYNGVTYPPLSTANSGIHSFGAIVFLLLSIVGFWFSLIFVSRSQWISFLFSLAVMVICLDSFMSSVYRREESKHPMQPMGISNMHQLSMHMFLLLALIAVVFGIAFFLDGRWIMLLLSIGAAVVAFDNMLLAKRKHEIH